MIPNGSDHMIRRALVEWRAAPPPYGNYEVSSDGRVRRNGREILQRKTKKGYLLVNLSHPPGRKTFRSHRLVCEVFHGPPPFPKAEAAHVDGVRHNNRADNLCWKSHQDNMNDQLRHGTRRTGESHWNSKLTQEAAAEIRRLRADGATLRSIANSFNISSGHVVCVARGDFW